MRVINKNVERVKRWRVANPEKRRVLSREYARRKRSTPEGRAHLAKIQTKARHKRDGIPTPPYAAPQWCEICARKRKLVIDHDHQSGKFRGWLCSSCNRGLGLLGDRDHNLANALRYLRGDKNLLGVI